MSKTPPLGERIFTYVMTEYRSLMVVVLALPLSMMWDLLLYLRWQWAAYTKVPVLHATRVERVVEQIKARPKGMRMCTGRPGWQCMSLSYRNYKSSMHQIDAVVDMIDIVSLDLKSETMSITVEPLVTTGQLTGALLHLGYTLPVVPEMDGLWLGGGKRLCSGFRAHMHVERWDNDDDVVGHFGWGQWCRPAWLHGWVMPHLRQRKYCLFGSSRSKLGSK